MPGERELVAKLGAAFLCRRPRDLARAAPRTTRPRRARGFRLRRRNRAVVTAATHAQKPVAYRTGFAGDVTESRERLPDMRPATHEPSGSRSATPVAGPSASKPRTDRRSSASSPDGRADRASARSPCRSVAARHPIGVASRPPAPDRHELPQSQPHAREAPRTPPAGAVEAGDAVSHRRVTTAWASYRVDGLHVVQIRRSRRAEPPASPTAGSSPSSVESPHHARASYE